MIVTVRGDREKCYCGVSDFQVNGDGQVTLFWPSTAEREGEEQVTGELSSAVGMRCVNSEGLAFLVQEKRENEDVDLIIEASREFPELAHYVDRLVEQSRHTKQITDDIDKENW